MWRFVQRASIMVAAVVVSAATAFAQVDRATLTGVVRDASDAVIPNARVTVTSLATDVATTVTTSSAGVYLVVNLMPGEYLVQAEANGFQRYEQTVSLELGARSRLDLSLALGSIGETVKVEGITPLLSTESAVVGTVVDTTEVDKLPLAIRNWDDLLAMVPGVQSDRYTEQAGGTSSGRTGGISVHGNRSLQNNFLLDGVANNSFSTNVQELTTQISRPSVDAIDEFKVVTSPYAAEYGWAPGAAIIVNTKSGTNQLRGTVYDFYRDDRMDTINYFAKAANQPKATNKQNQFGGNLGGPIPGVRAFFFGDYEGTRLEQGVLRTGNVMTAAQRQGIFTAPIRDPLTGQPFPNNTIPANRIDPVARAIMDLVPLPNTTGANNFIRQPNVEDESDRYLARLDLPLGNTNNLFVRYIGSNRVRFVPGWFGGILDGTSTSAWGRNFLDSHAVVGGWNKVLGAHLVNEARVSWARGTNDGQQDPFGQSGMDQIGFRGVPNDPRVAGGIVGIDIDGHIRLGSPNFMPKFQHTNQVQWLNTTTWMRGNHQIKFGIDLMMPMSNEYFDVAPTRGNLRFQNTFTGHAFADFLLGYPNRAELTNVFVVNQELRSQSFFVQDDWKPTDHLTLNLGLRYDFMTPPTEKDNRMANFNPSGAGALVFARDGSLADRALVKPDKNNFAPRMGAIYRINDRTLIRGGYGVFYNQFERIGSEDQLALNPPGLMNIQVNSPSGATTPVFFMRDGFPANYLDPSNLVIRNLKLRAAFEESPRTMVQQVGGGVERELTGNMVVSADVVTSFTKHLAVLRNLNQPLRGTLDANGPVPYPNFGNIQAREMTGEANYKGLDLSFEKRFTNGYGYRASYTVGEARDQAPEHLNASSGRAQNSRDLESWEGPSDFDIRHRFVANFIVELPFGEGKALMQNGVAGKILGGWLLSGIYSARSGRPFTVTQGGNNVGPDHTGVPNLTGDPEGAKTVAQWFNPAAFTPVTSGSFGNAGRNILRGPGWITFDMSVQRRIQFTDRANVTVRADIFNVFNRANFGLPAANISAPATVGVISTLAGDPRVMQLSLRLGF
ncbi:MAG TPA: TonB-dependent receptor [Vicinamibacterales bacterium]|nr:TonB-dependent receptor [Vicinamibacterales bacterium]